MKHTLLLAIAGTFLATGLIARAEDQQQTVPDQAPASSHEMTRNDMGGGMGNGMMTGQAQEQQSAPRGRGMMGQEMMGGMMGNQEMMAQMIRMMENCNRIMESQMQNQHRDDTQPQLQPDKKG